MTTWPKREFNFGPPTTSPRRLNFYGHFRRGDAAKRLRANRGVKPTEGSGLWRYLWRVAMTRLQATGGQE